MKKAFLVLAAVFGFAAQSMAQDKVTQGQLGEFQKIGDSGAITSAVPEELLRQNRSEDLQPEGCAVAGVDYGLTPAGMAKGYDWTSPFLTVGSFQATPRGKGKVRKEVCWFVFDPVVSSEEAQRRIETSGKFLVADLWELNALGTAKPDLQRQFPIVGLGSGWRPPEGDVGIPVLFGGGSGRRLDLRWGVPDDGWVSGFRFLAVRK